MRIMKCLSALLLFATLLMIFVGCADSASTTPPETAPGVVSDENGLVVTEERHTYLNKDLVLLRVENHSDKNYSITVTGQYLDEEGNVIRTQEETVDGWAAGYQGYLLFRPNRNFADFEYAVEVSEYTGECLASGISGSFGGLKEAGMIYGPSDYTVYPAVIGDWRLSNSHSFGVFCSGCVVLFDNTGEIYGIYEFSHTLIKANQADRYINQKIYQIRDMNLVWPEKLKGEVSGIVIVKSIERQ